MIAGLVKISLKLAQKLEFKDQYDFATLKVWRVQGSITYFTLSKHMALGRSPTLTLTYLLDDADSQRSSLVYS
jgi:hypothetical protein